MAAPSTPIFDWATNLNHSAPGEEWDGEVTKLNPSAGRQATGYAALTEPSAEEFNALFHNFSEWLKHLWSRQNDDVAQELVLSPQAGVHNASKWATVVAPSAGITNTVTGAYLIYDLNRLLPDGAEITDIQMMGTSGADRVEHKRMYLGVTNSTLVWTGTGTQTIVGSPFHSSFGPSGSGDRVIKISDGVGGGWTNIVIDKAVQRVLHVRTGVDIDPPDPFVADTIKSIRILFNAPDSKV